MSDNDDSIPLVELSPKDKSWDKHKHNADKVSNLYNSAGVGSYSLRVSLCAKQLQFALECTNNPDELVLKLKQAKFCRVRLCPICQWRRSLMWKAKAYKIIPNLVADYPSLKYIFLTLTVKNCKLENLRCTIDWMNYAWRKLVKRKCFPAVGWIKSIEVTRNNYSKTVHPHIHALLAVKPSYFGKNYIKQSRWKELWKDSLKVSYTPVVHVRKVSDVQSSIPEIFKYTTKESDYVTNDPEYLVELSEQLHKCRCFNTGGILRQYFAVLEDDDDMIGTDDQDNVSGNNLSFSWNSTEQQYLSETFPEKF